MKISSRNKLEFKKLPYRNKYVLCDNVNMIGSIETQVYCIPINHCFMTDVFYLYLSFFSVEKNYREKGYGKLILDKIEAIAKKNEKIKLLLLRVLPENKPALNLYRKQGYIQKNQKNRDYITMIKWLKPQKKEWDLREVV